MRLSILIIHTVKKGAFQAIFEEKFSHESIENLILKISLLFCKINVRNA